MVIAIPTLYSDAKSSPKPSPRAGPVDPLIDISRRPSPWHEIAHSLSTTSLPPLHQGNATPIAPHKTTDRVQDGGTTEGTGGRNGAAIDNARLTDNAAAITNPHRSDPLTKDKRSPYSCSSSSSFVSSRTPSPLPSTSHALREWEAKLSHPQPTATRHRLDPSHSNFKDRHGQGRHKLAAESDKIGFIEYKLKLIDPTNERFERLVTQLMWRLKQGKNEAIYELGLADDGTVVGLTRTEMDASLRTLELMASEVGATVIVLREIVLHTHCSRTSSLPQSCRPVPTPSRRRLRKLPNSNLSSPSDPHTVVLLGDQVVSGLSLSLERREKLSKNKARRRLKKNPFTSANGPVLYGGTIPKKLIFDPHDLQASSDDSLSDGSHGAEIALGFRRDQRASREDDGDDSPCSFFGFEEEDQTLVDVMPAPIERKPKTVAGNGNGIVAAVVGLPTSKKDEKKRRKSVARQEQRRLDLLRGDGTNPFWVEFDTGSAEVTTESHASATFMDGQPTATIRGERVNGGDCPANATAVPLNGITEDRATSPTIGKTPLSAISYPHSHSHQPARPSSLRLATPTEVPEDWFVDDLLHIPLDSLSLSFADVQDISADEERGDIFSDDTPIAAVLDTSDWAAAHSIRSAARTHQLVTSKQIGEIDTQDQRQVGINESDLEELICVEALVVRKYQYDASGADSSSNDGGAANKGGSGGGANEAEENWSYGGEEDVWGFGGGEDD
ncbi:hypothetical protein I316_03923 [Kwoniella heveanensis BCC8398]|uniref:GTP-binding protein 2 n=1 Tax=Kwoniella heveanensis BCC8398 TaxID=1296120 RepID=A0A1B9GTL5_9TREE|nr:hypothetical protein I316_03923 [Kwoniella heveanensis BCC8398]